jgi:hypothetical protein
VDQLSRTDQAKALRGFLSGAFDSSEFRERISGHATISGEPGEFRVDIANQFQVNVTVEPADLRPKLEQYLNWKCDDDELARWALLVTMLDSYSNPLGLSDGESDSLMDPMWDLLWDLGDPSLTGDARRDRVRQGVSRLEELQAGLRARAV